MALKFVQCSRTDDLIKDIPIIILTAAQTDKANRIKALELGVDAFLAKPIDEIELTAQIKAMLRLKELVDLKLDENLRLSILVLERTYDLENELLVHQKTEEELRRALAKIELSEVAAINLMEDLKAEVESRKKGEEIIRQSQQRMALHIEQTPLAVIEWDKDFKVREWNPSAEKIFGYSRKEAIGQNFSFIIPDNKQEQVNEIAFNLIKRKRGYRSTNENCTKNGIKIICEWFNTTLVDSEGKTFGVASLVHDISERRQAEMNLQQSNKYWDTTFNSIQDSIIMLDANQQIVKYNRAFANQSKVKINDAKDTCYNIVHGTNCPAEGCPFVEMKISKQRERLEYNSDNKFYDCMVDPIFDINGNIVGAVNIISDVTQRKVAELNLIKRNREIQSLLDAAKAVLDFENFDITAHKLFLSCKDIIAAKTGYLSLLGPNDDENHVLFLGLDNGEFIDKPMISTPIDGIQAETYKTGKPILINNFAKSEFTKSLPKDHIPFKNALIAPLIINKKVVGLLALTNKEKDFTEDDLKLASAFGELASIALHNTKTLDELVYQKEKAEESEKLKSAFLANMSHEIRTPLNAILGFSEYLCSPDLAEEKRNKYSDIIISSGLQLMQIINDIIDISKIESKLLSLSHKECDISEVLNNTIETFSNSELYKRKANVKLLMNLPIQYSDITTITDKTRLQQVLNNLITNALKATNSGYIEIGFSVKTENLSKYIEFYIKDTGIGIPADKQSIVFERFRQVDENGYREGTGLGLSISKGIIDLLGGKLWFDSEVNRGSTFYFTIPFVLSQTAKKEIKPIVSAASNLLSKTFIIAEDDVNSYNYLKELLFETQARIIHAENGQVLLNLLEKEKVDLIFLDINMPIKTGYQCMQEIKERGYLVKVIAQTAYALIEEKEKCLQMGCDGYMSKPFSKKVLFDTLTEVINK